MAASTEISWCDATFNPWRGCTKVSAECDACYAETMSKRNPSVLGIWGNEGTRVVAAESYWKTPLKWDATAKREGKRTRVFCASLADVFEEWPGAMHSAGMYKDVHGDTYFGDAAMGVCHGCGAWLHSQLLGECRGGEPGCSRVPRPLSMNDVRVRLFQLIDATPNLNWMLLTKRPENIGEFWMPVNRGGVSDHVDPMRSNVWLGVTAGLQETADRNVPLLLEWAGLSPCLWVSCEPMLGPVDFTPWLGRLDWIITGGESGDEARPCHPDWVRKVRDDCQDADVAFHHKQWGEWQPFENRPGKRELTQTPYGEFHGLGDWIADCRCEEGTAGMYRVGKKAAGRTLDGKVWDQFPAVRS